MNDIHGLKQAQEALRDPGRDAAHRGQRAGARGSIGRRPRLRFRFLNRHNEEWLGENREDLTGRTFVEVVGPEREAQLGPLLDRVLTGETVSTELLLSQPDGSARWESVHCARTATRRATSSAST
ncbi:MAG: PAS domain-containing protein [Burkholderiales bacterium]